MDGCQGTVFQDFAVQVNCPGTHLHQIQYSRRGTCCHNQPLHRCHLTWVLCSLRLSHAGLQPLNHKGCTRNCMQHHVHLESHLQKQTCMLRPQQQPWQTKESSKSDGAEPSEQIGKWSHNACCCRNAEMTSVTTLCKQVQDLQHHTC